MGKCSIMPGEVILFLPRLLNIPNPENKAVCRVLDGAHDNAPSQLVVEAGSTTLTVPLNAYIKEWRKPRGFLCGGEVRETAVSAKDPRCKDMLSIQVHPTKKNAELEFARKIKRALPLPHRTGTTKMIT